MTARRPGRSRRAVVPGRLEAWLLAFVQWWTRPGLRGELRRRLGSAAERVTHRVRQDGHGCQGDAAVRRSLHTHPAADQLQVVGICFQLLSRDLFRPGRHHSRRNMHRIARGHCSA